MKEKVSAVRDCGDLSFRKRPRGYVPSSVAAGAEKSVRKRFVGLIGSWFERRRHLLTGRLIIA